MSNDNVMTPQQALRVLEELVELNLEMIEHDSIESGLVEYTLEEGDKKAEYMDHPGILIIQIRNGETFYNFDVSDTDVVEDKRIEVIFKELINKAGYHA